MAARYTMDTTTLALVVTMEDVSVIVVIVRRRVEVPVEEHSARAIVSGRAVAELGANLLGQAALAQGLMKLAKTENRHFERSLPLLLQDILLIHLFVYKGSRRNGVAFQAYSSGRRVRRRVLLHY